MIITFDEASGDSSDCCGSPRSPNTGAPNGLGQRRRADRHSAAVALHQGRHRDDTPYNHYWMLRTIEDLFGLSHLGYAGRTG